MNEPTLTTFGCGAGTQSTAIALLVREGRLPKPDLAIFSDTGWEPRAVYDNLAVLRGVFEQVGVPFVVVGRGSSIRDDVLDRRVYATLPAFTIVEKTVRRPLAWERCDCTWSAVFGIGGERGASALAAFAPGTTLADLRAHDPASDEDCELCGADGHLDPDTVRRAVVMLDEAGLGTIPDPHRRCRSAGRVATRFHTYTVREKGRIKRECTGKYKIEPIEREIRRRLGATSRRVECRFCAGSGVRVAPWDVDAGEGVCSVCRGEGVRELVGRAPKGARVEHWIGFSVDEIDRATTQGFRAHTTPVFPLLDLGMTRDDCERLIRAHGLKPVKSACTGCPFHGNAYWRDLRDNHPEDWADAVEFDRQFRAMPGLKGERFLHISCLPLDQAPLGKPSRAELASAQGDLLRLAENGSSTGCSPYGCRSSQDEPVRQVTLPMPTVRKAS